MEGATACVTFQIKLFSFLNLTVQPELWLPGGTRKLQPRRATCDMRGTISGFHRSFVSVFSLKKETIGVFMAISLLLVPFDLQGRLLAHCKVG